MQNVYQIREAASLSDGVSPRQQRSPSSTVEVEHLRPGSLLATKSQASDITHETDDTVFMNDITREELNAKLETIETKMDARVESVSTQIEAFLAVQAERDQRFNERLASSITLSDEWNQKFRMLAEQSAQAAISADSSAKEAATLKTHFWASVVAQVLAVGAIVVGAYLANQANVLSAVSTTVSVFQAGKDQSKTVDLPPAKKE